MDIEMNQVLSDKQEKKIRKRKKGLYRNLVKQLEFYFSDANMTKSKFMQEATKDDPWIEISTFLKFNKINTLLANFGCENPLKELTKALEVVDSDLLESSEGKVKRGLPLAPKPDEDECTIYVENISIEMDHDTLKKIFSVYGKVVYVSIPKYRDFKTNKGFAFVEFEEVDVAKKALEAFGADSSVIDAKMEPGDLLSIKTFNEEKDGKEQSKENMESEGNLKKRKNDAGDEETNKKVKLEDEDELKKKKKKPRLRKESGTESGIMQGDGQSTGIKILSKIEWKRLRNQYLNLQRKNMKLAKQKYKKQAFQSGPKQKEGELKEVEVGKQKEGKVKEKEGKQKDAGKESKLKETEVGKPKDAGKEGKVKEIDVGKQKDAGKDHQSDGVSKTPNVIVKVTVKDGVEDVKKLKHKIRELLGGEAVGYVDARVGAPEAHVRCRDQAQANKLANVTAVDGWKWVKIQGEEEGKYWEKIEEDRQDKRQGKVKIPKEKKKNKLIKNIEKSKGVHTYFGE